MSLKKIMYENDSYNYKGWMTSDFFLKRAIGTLLYVFVGQIIVVIFVAILMIIASIFAAFVFGLTAF